MSQLNTTESASYWRHEFDSGSAILIHNYGYAGVKHYSDGSNRQIIFSDDPYKVITALGEKAPEYLVLTEEKS